MVGLRWWNQVDDDGKSHWVFEARKVKISQSLREVCGWWYIVLFSRAVDIFHSRCHLGDIRQIEQEQQLVWECGCEIWLSLSSALEPMLQRHVINFTAKEHRLYY